MRRSDRYTRTAIALHWLIALAVIVQFSWGWWMIGIAKQPVGPRVDAFNLHKSIGLTILLLMVVRSSWRLTHPAPALPAMRRWQAMLAHATHVMLYLMLFVQPLAGYLGSVFSGYPVKYFGWVIPAWGWKDDGLKEFMSALHFVGAITIGTLVAVHLAGALWHALVLRDGLLARMGLGRAK
jgi:cytochrome b561